MTFGDKLKAERLKRNMSQREFAKLLGTFCQVISRYERNENLPKITTVEKWAEKLGVSVKYLIVESETYPYEKNSPTELTADEAKIITLYRSLPEHKKQTAFDCVCFLLSK